MPFFAKIALPLYKLLYKDGKWILSTKHTETMHALQNACIVSLSSLLVMCLPDFQKAFQLETNASYFLIGLVLSYH